MGEDVLDLEVEGTTGGVVLTRSSGGGGNSSSDTEPKRDEELMSAITEVVEATPGGEEVRDDDELLGVNTTDGEPGAKSKDELLTVEGRNETVFLGFLRAGGEAKRLDNGAMILFLATGFGDIGVDVDGSPAATVEAIEVEEEEPKHFLVLQACFIFPGPPNFGMSSQNTHTPQFALVQLMQVPHFLVFFAGGLDLTTFSTGALTNFFTGDLTNFFRGDLTIFFFFTGVFDTFFLIAAEVRLSTMLSNPPLFFTFLVGDIFADTDEDNDNLREQAVFIA